MELKERLEELLDRAIANQEIAGANVLIMKNGRTLAYAEAGYANVDMKKPYRKDTIYRAYSCSKPITAVAAMILVERGLLDLAKPVGDYLPVFQNIKVYEKERTVTACRPLLVQNLLSMTSGLPYGTEGPLGEAIGSVWAEVDRKLHTEEALTTMEVIYKLAECGLCFHPGDQWMYGTSADVVGALIEQISGKKLSVFLQEELFGPLGMADTGFYVPKDKQERLADAYERTPEGMKLFYTDNLGIRYAMDKPPAFESGGAGLVTTISDYAKFARMLLQEGRFEDVQILAPQTVRFLTGACLTPWQQESLWRSWDSMQGYTYGNFMRIMKEPDMAFFQTWKGEYGWDGWLGAYFINSPKNGITVLLSTQTKDAGTMDLTRKIRNVLATYIEE